MNSAIASSINGSLSAEKDSFNQKSANSARAALLIKTLDFTQPEVKKPTYVSSVPGQFLCKIESNEVTLNGQKKLKNGIDQNRNALNNSYIAVNGNKEKVEDGIPAPRVQLYNGKISVDWKQIYKIGAGLHNMGNTCFMNTVLQCLTYCPPLANYLLQDNSDHSSKCTVTSFCMMCTLQKHMKKTIGKTGDVVKPYDVYQRLKLISKNFQFGRQEDAHELLRYVIDHLVKSCLLQNSNYSKLDAASKETTVINQIFGGYQRSQVTCLRCKEKSNTFDYFMDFILDIKQNVQTIEKALDKYTQPELLEQENAYKCPKCKMKVTAHKRFTVFKPPNVATFQFKRFDYNRSFGGKITKLISYPERLNLRPYLSESKGEPVWYRLNAVLVHAGASCNSGHYYCYVKNSNGCWYIMDDERVHQVSLAQVLNQCAYVLFYVKAETAQSFSNKKCSENRNPIIKGNLSPFNFKKNSEASSIKPSPLKERSQAKFSSPTLKPQLSSLNNNKLSMSPNQNKDHTSSGIQPSMPTMKDIHKPVQIDGAPPKKAKHSASNCKASNDHSGLVPYNKDSSESSDDNESICNGNSLESKGSCPDSVKLNGAKVNLKFNRTLSPKPDAKRKFGKSSGLSPTPSQFSKVVATSAWIVTDAGPVSPSAASTSSCNSVHSTTDWHVTSTKAEPNVNNNNNSSKPVSERNGHAKVPENKTPSSGEEKRASLNRTFDEELTSTPDKRNGTSPSKKCDFRKQHSSQNEPSFLGDQKTSGRQQQSSLLKRKRSESDTKVTEVYPQLHNGEGRHNSVPKKAKHSKEFSESPALNGLGEQKSGLDSERSFESGSSKSYHAKANHKSESPSWDNRHKAERAKEKKKWRDGSSSPEECNSSVEYEWVEKTKDSIEKSLHSPSKDKHNKGSHSGSSSHSKSDRKHDVVDELNKSSGFFYGSAVPTWKGENHYYDSNSLSAKRKSFDDYEDEYDRGKTRKFKNKDQYHKYPYYKNNPFQKQSERNYNYSKYNGNSHYAHYNHHKSYNSHYKWKQNRNHDHQQHRKYFRPHFQR